MRPHQYYKNVLVFFGLFFSKNMLRMDLWLPIIVAFIILCLVSSLNYFINDLRDIERDKLHPEKKTRPLPSGKISIIEALLLAFFLFISVILLTFLIPINTTEIYFLNYTSDILEVANITIPSKTAFFLVLGGLFVTSQVYSLLLKKIVFADIIAISVNYVWRAIAGAVLINVSVSPWLIILCFTTAMLLSIAKRKGDLAVLGENAHLHKEVFQMYSSELLNQSLATIAAIELIAVFIYLVERHKYETVFIVLALPLFSFIIFRYLFLVSSDSATSRRAERIFLDKQIILAGTIIGILFFLAIYYPNFLDNLIGIPDPRL